MNISELAFSKTGDLFNSTGKSIIIDFIKITIPKQP